MKTKGMLLALALIIAIAAPVGAQITANALPPLEGLPAVWTPAAPVFPVPTQWSATVSYAVTNPAPGLWTYWYQVNHTGGAVMPIQVLKSATLNLDPAKIQQVGPVYQFGQADLGPGQSWAAESVLPGDSTIRWSIAGAPGMNALATGDTIYLWLRSPYPQGPLVNFTLQDGSVGQTLVAGPAPVPEPVSVVLVGLGLGAVSGLRRRRS